MKTTLFGKPTSLPTNKVVASTVGAAFSTIAIYVLNDYLLPTPLPTGVEVAVITLITALVGYLTPPGAGEGTTSL